MKTLTAILTDREICSRRGNEADGSGKDHAGIRLLTSAATFTKLALAAVMLTAAVAAQAEWVNGHFRSNGTYVNSYYRTPANGTSYDNFSYRGYPSQQPGYLSSRSYGCDSYYSMPSTISSTSTAFGNTTYHNYRNSFGDSWSGATRRFGNTAYTTLNGW